MSAAARLDYDKPGPDDAYVLRLEDAEGWRVKAVVSQTELVSYAGDPVDLITSKASALAYLLEIRRKKDPLAVAT